jgi:nicotinic acid mononucleotide adenylyltransferase
MSSMKTVVFIGTFDPLHGAHIGQMLRAYYSKSFSKAYVLVDKHPAHKPHASSWRHRVQMARLTLESFELPFDYEVIAVENSAATEFTANVDYRITGTDALIDNITDPSRLTFAQRWPMIVISIPGIPFSDLVSALDTLPTAIQSTIRFSYVSKAEVPMMNYDFQKRAFISERVHSRYLRGGRQNGLIPESVQNYIRKHQLYS